MLITSIPNFAVQYDQDLGLLRVEWSSDQDMRTFRTGTRQLLALAKELKVRAILLNMNSFPDISVYDQVWLGTNWMPGLLELPLERLVLAIDRQRVHNQLAIDALLALFGHRIRFDIQFFLTAAPGLHWLCDGSGRLSALLAEWNALYGLTPPMEALLAGLPAPQAGPSLSI